jgi:predicted unusual protein kinase regulating ubiquinone biosynthesis (AarF/ABC1/UbiB family)
MKKRERVFAFLSLFFGIVWDFWREARLTRRGGSKYARRRMSERHRRRAIKFREAALKMGGVLIKLGQFLSTRADLMPEEYIEELGKLQDQVPAVSYEEIKQVIEEEFGKPVEEVFSEFYPSATAAASLAQVHHAVLPTGEKVAVKVQRPGIDDLINTDLAIFSYIMEGVHRFTRVGNRTDIPGLVEEFARVLGEELDFYREGYNAERFRKNFEGNPIIYIPKIYWDYTRDRVLTLEAVEGIKINDYKALEEAGIDRTEVAYEVVQSYMQQVLEDGFFHADPHPGNLFVVPGPEITFVDFGMVGEITPEMKGHLKEAAVAIARKDISALMASLLELGFIRRGANLDSIRNAINWMFDVYAGFSSHQITFETLDQIQEDIRTIVYEQPLTIPAHFGFLGRAVGILLGLTTGLDPQFDFIGSARPYLQKMVGLATEDWIKIVTDEAKTLGRIFLNLPKQLSEVLAQAQKGDLGVRINSGRIIEAIDRSGRRNTTGLAIASSSFVIASVILYINAFPNEAYAALAVGLLILALGFWRRLR